MMIKRAFDRLYNRGLICRVAMPGTKKEAASALAARARERLAAREPCAGAVFFLAEDVKKGTYPLYFGPIVLDAQRVGMPAKTIGALTVEAILKSGGWCQWDGDPTHAITVKEN